MWLPTVKLRNLLSIIASLLFLGSHAMAQMAWSHYVVSRYGTEADIPSHFQAAEAPGAGDGRIFSSPDGQGEIRLWAGFNVLSTDLDGYLEEREEYLTSDGFHLSYKDKGQNWFVLSGNTDQEAIYLVVRHGEACEAELMHHIQLRFPLSKSQEWTPIIQRASQSLNGPC